jgi:hypothetical protein
MPAVGFTRLRLALLAAMVAFAGAVSPRVAVQTWTPSETSARLETFDATTLVEALPPSLTPEFEPGLRLVALVASDIDADGDLDLVANDGSLDLMVWLNDGAGHFTRRYAHQSPGWRDNTSTANGGGALDPVSAIATAGASVRAVSRLILALTANPGWRARSEKRASDLLFARSHSSRAPPHSLLSL